MQLIQKLDRSLAKIEEWVLALLLIGMVLLAATQVILRNIWSTAIDWADVTLQNVTLLVGLLGAALATSEGRHLNIDVFSRLFDGRGKAALRVTIGCFAVVVCWQLTLGGWATYQANYLPWAENVPAGWSAMRLLRQEIAEGSIPQWLSQIPLALGFGLITLHFFLRLLCDLTWLISGKQWHSEEEQSAEGEAFLDELEARAAGSDPQ